MSPLSPYPPLQESTQQEMKGSLGDERVYTQRCWKAKMEIPVRIARCAIRKRLGHYWWAFLMLAGTVLFLPGCEQKTINHILADPQRYANHEVEVVGKVARSYSVLGHGAYQVDDGTGILWVVSKTGVPREGARVGVKGTIRLQGQCAEYQRGLTPPFNEILHARRAALPLSLTQH